MVHLGVGHQVAWWVIAASDGNFWNTLWCVLQIMSKRFDWAQIQWNSKSVWYRFCTGVSIMSFRMLVLGTTCSCKIVMLDVCVIVWMWDMSSTATTKLGKVMIVARDTTYARFSFISVVMIETHPRRCVWDNGKDFVSFFAMRRQCSRHCCWIAIWCIRSYTVFLLSYRLCLLKFIDKLSRLTIITRF